LLLRLENRVKERRTEDPGQAKSLPAAESPKKAWDAGRNGVRTMPAYDIRYLDGQGSLAHKFSAECDNDKRARVLAHAMKLPSAERLEIWLDDMLVYARDIVPMALAH
jgi:hypothetical protein